MLFRILLSILWGFCVFIVAECVKSFPSIYVFPSVLSYMGFYVARALSELSIWMFWNLAIIWNDLAENILQTRIFAICSKVYFEVNLWS